MRNDKDKKEEIKIRAVGAVFAVKEDSLVILEKDGPEDRPVGVIKFGEIKDIAIKPAGMLYDGEVSFLLKNGGSIKYKIKKFHQEDFEDLKKKLGI